MYFNSINDLNDPRMIVGYSRVSRKEQLEGYSIYNQDATAKRIAESLGGELAHIYKDEAKSAYKNVIRKDFELLLQDVKKNKIKIVIVWKSDRLVRNFVKSEKIYQLFLAKKVSLVSATQFWDFSTADGRKEARKRSVDDQYESERTSERVTEVAKAGASLGNFPKGHIPLGYRRIHHDYKTAPIMIDEIDGDKVALIFNKMYKNKWGVNRMLHWLNSNNYMDRTWNERYLYRMLQNPIYIGTYVNCINNPKYTFKNHSPALIDETVFNGVCDLIHSRYFPRKYFYTYKGFVYCAECHRKMTPNPTVKKAQKKLYLYYHCEKCNRRINESKLNNQIVRKFNQIIMEEEKDFSVLKEKISELKRLEFMIEQLDQYYLEETIDKNYYIINKKNYISSRNDLMSFIELYKKKDIVLFEEMENRAKKKWLQKHIQKIDYHFEMKIAHIITNKP